MQFDKFTHKSQETIQSAQQLAQDSSHQEIQVEHLVKAILTQPGSIVVPVLKKLGVDPSLLLGDVNQILKDIPQVSGQGVGQSYISQDLKMLIDTSFSVAQQMQDDYISQEHLFLAAFKDKKSAFYKTLTRLGIDEKDFLQALSAIRGSGSFQKDKK